MSAMSAIRPKRLTKFSPDITPKAIPYEKAKMNVALIEPEVPPSIKNNTNPTKPY